MIITAMITEEARLVRKYDLARLLVHSHLALVPGQLDIDPHFLLFLVVEEAAVFKGFQPVIKLRRARRIAKWVGMRA